MPDLPTRLDLFSLGANYVTQRAKRIDPQQVRIAGSDVNIFVGSVSQIAFALVLQLVYRINSLLLDGAQDEELDRYAFDRYQLLRRGASAALGTVRFYRATSAAGLGSVPVGTKLLSLTGAEYITTTTATFSATALEATADVRAVQAGKDTQVGANAIRQIDGLDSLWDQSLKVNNDAPTAGGEDAEEDDDFKNRIRGFWNAARRGTLGAIEYGAQQTEGVFSAQAVEALTPGNQPARVVVLYFADSSGVASAALGTAVRETLMEYRAGGIAVIPSTSQPQIISIVLKLSFNANANQSALTEAIRAAVVEYVNSLPVNGPLYRSELKAVLVRFVQDGLIVTDDTISTPAGDVYPDPGKTLRMTLSNLTVQL